MTESPRQRDHYKAVHRLWWAQCRSLHGPIDAAFCGALVAIILSKSLLRLLLVYGHYGHYSCIVDWHGHLQSLRALPVTTVIVVTTVICSSRCHCSHCSHFGSVCSTTENGGSSAAFRTSKVCDGILRMRRSAVEYNDVMYVFSWQSGSGSIDTGVR